MPEDKRLLANTLEGEWEEGAVYCSNDGCETEAVWVVENLQLPLCSCCKQAFEWGQHNPLDKVSRIPSFRVQIDTL